MNQRTLTKQKEIKRFILRDASLVRSPTIRFLSHEGLSRAIRENNKHFEMLHDPIEMRTVVQCNNKPRDMPVYGIVWEELHGD